MNHSFCIIPMIFLNFALPFIVLYEITQIKLHFNTSRSFGAIYKFRVQWITMSTLNVKFIVNKSTSVVDISANSVLCRRKKFCFYFNLISRKTLLCFNLIKSIFISSQTKCNISFII